MSRPKLSSGDRYSPQEDETRQEYANARIQEWQRYRAGMMVLPSFEESLSTFRYFGKRYDKGARLRDLTEGAA